MKILLIPFMFILASCCKEDEKLSIYSDCIQMKTNPAFITEAFKDGYTIQFPPDYTGEGLKKEFTATFEKKSLSDISFSYLYSFPVDGLIYFGQKLANPIPDKLESTSQILTENLALKKEFCINNDIELILYYNLESNTVSYGKLYMKHNDWYYEGLNVTFRAELFEEVISIIKTIKKV